MSPVGTTSLVTATNIHFGVATIDSLLTPVTYTLPVPTFGGAITQSTDTMFVNAGTGTTFDTTASTVRFRATTTAILPAATRLRRLKGHLAPRHTGPAPAIRLRARSGPR